MNPTEGGQHGGVSRENNRLYEVTRGMEQPMSPAEVGNRSLADELGEDDDFDGAVEGDVPDGDGTNDYHEGQSPFENETPGMEELGLPSDIPDIGPETPPMASPADSGSIPDDTPSLIGSQASIPVRLAASPSVRGSISRSPSGALQPFERRFQSRFSASPSPSPRTGSPGFLRDHSRQSSMASEIPNISDAGTQDIYDAPWEVVRWTRLRKIAGQAFSEVGKRQFGTPTCLAVSASIVIGTSKGLVLVFNYHQTLKHILGQGSRAAESGAVTSLALAADYSTIAAGHATGHIFTWEIAHPGQPFLHIPPVTRSGQGNFPDGHVPGRAVLHVGFLGTRHTALVSADDGGMAFSHLATRGLGSLGRSVRTTRLLGRYPSPNPQDDLTRKPSSVLAFAPLPLGNVEQATDTMGLTALLTPYILVVVSTTPLAQTQHKAARPKDTAAHGAVSGCLAWFPAVKLKNPINGKDVSSTKLVYCWSDVLTVVEVEVGEQDDSTKEKQPSISFHARSKWQCEEAIVAVQWLSRSVIGALTISQRLVIIEDGTLHVMDSVDLLQRHIYHQDFFSEQLHSVVERNEHNSYMHGVVADAFLMSFRAYKGRLFLLGFSDISVGTLSNWADRISALVENGNDIGAIKLAITYYNGDAGRVSVGLPEDTTARHELVKERLLELLTASIQFRVSENAPDDGQLSDVITECFRACLLMSETSFLLEDIYEIVKDAEQETEFLELLEEHVMDDDITALPPVLLKDAVNYFVSRQRDARLEEMLCRLDAHTFDIDEITKLCKRHLLYDALIYVWNQALFDWVTPLAELIALIRDRDMTNGTSDHTMEDKMDAANKSFSYLAFSLTGRLYPKGDFMDDEQADTIKQDLYKFLFSDQIVPWPPGSSTLVRTKAASDDEPTFPYLRLLLGFDTASFMSMLNEAFEDPFLNANQEQDHDGLSTPTINGTTSKITRQQIVSVLLDVMSESEFEPDQTIYLDMFIARTLPKYPQFIILSGSSLQRSLTRLCTLDSDDLADECQLSVEYLLSIYHPSMTQDLIELLRQANFYRVLKSIYRSERRYEDLVKMYFQDAKDHEDIFNDLSTCFTSDIPIKQRLGVEQLLCFHATQLAFIDLTQAAAVLARYASHIIPAFLENLQESRLQFAFLRSLLEPDLDRHYKERGSRITVSENLVTTYGEQYVKLMCEHDPTHVADYVRLLKSGDLQLSKILPLMEENGVIDAAVLLLAQDGLARDAMDRLVKHLQSLQNALCSLMEAIAEAPDPASSQEAATDLVEAIEKYVKLGVWLCQGQTQIASRRQRPNLPSSLASTTNENDLDLDEYLWLTLIDLLVSISKELTATVSSIQQPSRTEAEKPILALRSLVQQVFTALLSSTATPSPATAGSSAPTANVRRLRQANHSFLHIFRAFLTRAAASAPSLSDLRAVLLDIFAAYAYEADVLALSSQLLGADAFEEIAEVHALRQRGWRARAQVCEKCKLRAWGPGIGDGVWDEFLVVETERAARKSGKTGGAEMGRGKGKEVGGGLGRTEEMEAARKRMRLVVFVCRHVFHQACLDEMGAGGKDEEGRYTCPLCVEKADANA